MARGKGTTKRRVASVAAVAAVPFAREVGFTSSFQVTSSQNVSPTKTWPTESQSSLETRGPKAISCGSGAILAGVATAVAHNAKKRCGKSHPKPSPLATCSVGESTATVLEKAATAEEPTKLFEQYIKDRGGERVLRKLLIANNGMAATKAILSLRQWSYLELGSDNVFEFVVMATPEDLEANAEFIRLANSYVEVPGGKNVNNYANVDLIVDVAKSQGTLHLGWSSFSCMKIIGHATSHHIKSKLGA